MAAHIYSRSPQDEVIEVQNWEYRGDGNAMVGRVLTSPERSRYEELRAGGASDTEIWRELHPGWPEIGSQQPAAAAGGSPALGLGELTPSQLLALVERRVGASLPSLRQASAEDLRRLLRSLHGDRPIRIDLG